MTTHSAGAAKTKPKQPLLRAFAPPGNATDLESAAALKGWSELISGFCEQAKQRLDDFLQGQPRQFFNPTLDVVSASDSAQLPILWQGFPKSVERKYGANSVRAFRAAEKISGTRVARQQLQDEYLEWHVTRDPHSKKITRVEFTCEGPEYWQYLAEQDADAVVALYRKHISEDVQKSDLFTRGTYNPLNAWNVNHGAMHLIHPSNTLSAEIFLAADATITRHNAQGDLITDANELIECAGFGVASRASDPHIGDLVNGLSRQGYSVSLQDPIGLYIHALDASSFRKPDGKAAGDYFRIERGTKTHTLRAVYEVPEGETSAGRPFVVGDLLIAGEPCAFGGQIAKHITMRLTGLAVGKGHIDNQSVPCGEPGRAAKQSAAAPRNDNALDHATRRH